MVWSAIRLSAHLSGEQGFRAGSSLIGAMFLWKISTGDKSPSLDFPVLARTKYQASGKLSVAGGLAANGRFWDFLAYQVPNIRGDYC